mmetsp:Transcript_94900/g.267965  ORF Transcript_94900/g.267965 Transcript_94900/m.267965 type:complete len:571 (-) Transcript_94900:61-1773(-)
MADLRVCVIGAGAAGLTTMKQLRDQRITNIDCFEKDSDVGGIFHYGVEKNGVYDNAVLTISNYLMAFSDMPPTGHRYHWHHTEYLEYLQEYARKFDLSRHISFGTTVQSIEGEPGRWHVVVKGADGREVDRGYYDFVAVCSGAHQGINIPDLPGLDSFSGKVVHSSTYKNNAEFVGKDCVVIGLGESGADIVREIADVASRTVLAIRSFPYLIPRLVRPFHTNPLGCSSDAFTSHLRHDLLNVPIRHYRRLQHFLNRLMCTIAAFLLLLFPSLGRGREAPTRDAFNQDVAGGYVDKDTKYSPLAAKLIYSFCNLSGQGERGQKFACKNVTFVEHMVQGKIVTNASGIRSVEGEYVLFNDGSRARCECIVLCTGYKDEFPFLKGNIGKTGIPLSVPAGNVRRLYKHIFHPEIGKSMAWVGFVRPTTGGIPACAEMAARYVALVVTGQRELPRDIAKRTSADFDLDQRFYSLSPNVNTLVGYKDWMDSMAELVGCEVRLWRYILQPRLFVHLCVGSLLPSQYRLSGPGQLLGLAKATILSVPVAPTASQTLDEVSRAWLRHLGLKKLSPNDE